jgi:uncharacterized protein YgbK (DUF1537 family)
MPDTPKWLVLADDMTGACETAAALARADRRCLLLPGPNCAPPPRPADALVINTDSRHEAPAEAAGRIKTAVAGLASGFDRVYKKIDSTLRGNVGAELEALMEALTIPVLPVVPAFPQAGRTIRDGRLFVHGKALARSELASDPYQPATSSDVAEILGRQTSIEVCCLKVEDLDALGQSRRRRMLVFDAETPDDLDRIADSLARHDLLTAVAGAAGMLEALGGGCPSASGAESGPTRSRLLVVNGSLSPVARSQARRAVEIGFDAVDPEAPDAPNRIFLGLSAGGDVLLESPPSSGGRGDRAIADRLGKIVSAALGKAESRPVLVVFGGDTAQAVVRRLAVAYLEPRRMLWPGVIELAAPYAGGDLTLVTKSGGFGHDSLVEDLRAIYSMET